MSSAICSFGDEQRSPICFPAKSSPLEGPARTRSVGGFLELGDLHRELGASFVTSRKQHVIIIIGVPPETRQFNILMRDMVRLGELGGARNVFDEMRRRGVRPTVVSFNILISGACKAGDLDGANALRGLMLGAGVVPDVYTFGALIQGLCKAGRLRDAADMFEELRQTAVNPNAVVFTTLIDAHCKVGNVAAGLELYRVGK